ncbi:pyridoxal-dependent decarboxylase [Aporhodopirellula aestuarii]|uniref:Pyridoxal-dependent decarboxylase n=1 Tax=Aporhodopirellula aestuarii TaxID=2950107 RepID=A0ABT0U5Z2_9BACT|nr:pyridoxal-dependent decarboxylase [Aporhodopirellula aestuarii]MCM2372300.1 pyridoxal-dependent decarboxylase [Aporhodopirellula aestuarii]
MFSRRQFFGLGGIGMLTLSAGCQPDAFQRSVFADDISTRSVPDRVRFKSLKDHLLGYPINMNTPSDGFFRWREQLAEEGVDTFAFNNVGNPFKASPIPFNTHDYERDTILAFGNLFEFPADDLWGFLSHSGTDSNMHGMYMGRTILRGRTGLLPKTYFTREAHYSVQILRDLLGLETVMVDTLADGGMNPDDLASKLADNSNSPALVVATVGTTFKGAIDNIDEIQKELAHHESYVHVDAALFGGYLPFTNHSAEVSCQSGDDSVSKRYDSIAVSCHKFFGFPSPAGLFITRQSIYDEFNELFSRIHNPEYIHHVPGTIICSRDAVKPAEFYYFTTPQALTRQRDDARLMLDNAAYFFDQLNTHFPQLGATRANELSNTIYFRSPGETIIKKYSLATMHLDVDDQSEEYAHVVVMPHVSRNVLAKFLSDLEGLHE